MWETMKDVRDYEGCERLWRMWETMRDVRNYEGCERLRDVRDYEGCERLRDVRDYEGCERTIRDMRDWKIRETEECERLWGMRETWCRVNATTFSLLLLEHLKWDCFRCLFQLSSVERYAVHFVESSYNFVTAERLDRDQVCNISCLVQV